MTDWLNQIDFCIKTYLRPQACENLIASIRRFYPTAAITTNDDPCIAKGRNELVKRTKRPFLLMLDDDFLFTEETDVESLYEVVGSCPAVAAGSVVDVKDGVRVPRNSGGNIRREGNVLRLDCVSCGIWRDVVPNFFLIERNVFHLGCCPRWRFGIGAEHADFFMQLKTEKWGVAQYPEITIDHDLNAPALPGYKAARWNIAANVLAFMNHWGIDRVVVNGKVAHTRLPIDAIRNDASGFACHPVGRSQGV